MRRCRECGCVDECACVRDGLLGREACHWVAADLCSACEEPLIVGEWEHPPRELTDQCCLDILAERA